MDAFTDKRRLGSWGDVPKKWRKNIIFAIKCWTTNDKIRRRSVETMSNIP